MIAINHRHADVKPGDRVELIYMQEDPDPVPAGTQGTVQLVNHMQGWSQIDVAWDNGRSLMMVTPPDKFRILQRSSGSTSSKA